jgi:hypothetical protein
MRVSVIIHGAGTGMCIVLSGMLWASSPITAIVPALVAGLMVADGIRGLIREATNA